ncbi:unnamed protein product [Cylindrotheca closterium]|uniref:Uncharacterized protein n=1 Tax=Cylindrotheca closterium TaxID=2856 RepID=A0AAD2JMY6_9STRA|nr:unnamed protein product [Cylindrotheca closterium]
MSQFDDIMSASFSDLSLDITDEPTQDPTSVTAVPENDIVVFVSSRTFLIQPSLFEQVKGLPWSESGGYSHLDAEPQLFEAILTFYLAGSFPGRVLVKERKEALSNLVSHLGDDAKELKACIAQGGGGRKGNKFTKSPISMKKGLRMGRRNSNGSAGSVKNILKSPFKSKKAAVGDDVQPSKIADLANAPLLDGESDIGSEAGTSTLSDYSHNEKPHNHEEVKQRRWSLGRRSSSKKLHEEWCQSEYIV